MTDLTPEALQHRMERGDIYPIDTGQAKETPLHGKLSAYEGAS